MVIKYDIEYLISHVEFCNLLNLHQGVLQPSQPGYGFEGVK